MNSSAVKYVSFQVMSHTPTTGSCTCAMMGLQFCGLRIWLFTYMSDSLSMIARSHCSTCSVIWSPS